MKAALAEQQAKEAAESERRQQQQAHKQAHKERIEAWRNKNKVGACCCCTAAGSMHAGCSWQPPGGRC
jgi:uncharacterized protein YjhX (UPF0386 family)